MNIEIIYNSDLDGIIAEIDTDGSGTVDFDGKHRKRVNILMYLFMPA